MNKTVKATVSLKAADMFCFLMHYSYASAAGVIGLAFSLFCFVLLVMKYTELEISYIVLLLVCALLFTVINPFMLWLRAKKQVSTSPALKQPVEYEFDAQGIHMSIENEKADLKWKEIYKIKKIAGRYIFYINRMRSNIVPVTCLKGDGAASELDAIIKEYYRKA